MICSRKLNPVGRTSLPPAKVLPSWDGGSPGNMNDALPVPWAVPWPLMGCPGSRVCPVGEGWDQWLKGARRWLGFQQEVGGQTTGRCCDLWSQWLAAAVPAGGLVEFLDRQPLLLFLSSIHVLKRKIFIDVSVTCNKTPIFKVYNLVSIDICTHLWNHHYNQDDGRNHHPQSLPIPFRNSSLATPTSPGSH